MIMGRGATGRWGVQEVGETVEIGYVDQRHADYRPGQNGLGSGQRWDGSVGNRWEGRSTAGRTCRRFNFNGGDQQKKCGVLSGGERNRLHLAMTLKTEANVLLLDEPTNDIDVDTLRALGGRESNLLRVARLSFPTTGISWTGSARTSWRLKVIPRCTGLKGTYSEYEENQKEAAGSMQGPQRVKYRKFVRD